MNKKLKIKISNDAFDFIVKLLEFHDEYDCIALKEPENGGCCKNSKVDIILDNTINYNVIEDIQGLNIAYSEDLSSNFNGCGSKSKDCTSCSGCSMKSK